MRLERLEIAGFKSFSDRSELAFDRGVTAIVGPNGCGKSNVADAITWVLGEQSAKSLRGEKMEDVIFSGSDARKPTGAAEVRLRLSGVDDACPARPSRRTGSARPRNSQRQRSMATARQRQRSRPRPTPDVQTRSTSDPLVAPRSRSDAPAVSVGRERVPDRRRSICRLKRHPRAADGHGPWREGLRDHRAGQDRHDPQLAADRSAPADRRSRRHHQVQGAPPRRGAEARSGAAEPHAHRRHRLRGREAARHAQAPGRKGAPVSAAARRAAALGESAVRPEVPRAGAGDRIGARRGSPTRASAKRAAAARRGDRDDARRAPHRAGRGRRARRPRRASARTRTSSRSADRAADRVRTRSRSRCSDAHDGARAGAARRSTRGASRQRLELEERRDAAADAERNSTRRGGEARGGERRVRRCARARSKGSRATSKRRAANVYGALNSATALRQPSTTPPPPRERVARDARASTSKRRTCASRASASPNARVGAEQALAARRRRSSRRVSHVRRSSPSSATRARRARGRCAQELRSREHDLAGLGRAPRSLEELEAARAGFTRRRRVVLAEANGNGRSAWAPSPTGSRSTAATSAPSRRCSATCCSTSSSGRTSTRRTGFELLRAARCRPLRIRRRRRRRKRPWPRPCRAIEGARFALAALSGAARPGRMRPPCARSAARLRRRRRSTPPSWRARGHRSRVATPDGDVVRGRSWSSAAAGTTRAAFSRRRARSGSCARVSTTSASASPAARRWPSALDRVTATIAAIEARSAELHEPRRPSSAFDAQLRGRRRGGRLERKGELLARSAAAPTRSGTRSTPAGRSAQQSMRARNATARDDGAQRGAAAAPDARDGRSRSPRVSPKRGGARRAGRTRTALAAEVLRLEEAAREMEMRLAALSAELAADRDRRGGARSRDGRSAGKLDAPSSSSTRSGRRPAAETRRRAARHGGRCRKPMRDARARSTRSARAAERLEVARATAEGDLAHLRDTCVETVQATLDEIVAEVDELEQRERRRTGARSRRRRDEDEERAAAAVDAERGRAGRARPEQVDAATGSTAESRAEEAIAGLRAKIDRLGPVNMMAIEQFDELETRHTFLTTQRKDLVDSIAADQRGHQADRRDVEGALPRGVRRDQPATSSRRSRRCSAAAAPASRCSTRTTRSRAASTSSPSRPASACRASSCCRAARRR